MPAQGRLIPSRAEFDREAASYDRTALETMPRYEELHRMLLWGIPYLPTRALRILELGCGTGTLTARLLEGFAHARVVAVDLSPQMLARARRKLARWKGRVEFVRAHLAELEVEGPFDAIVSALALHHLSEAER